MASVIEIGDIKKVAMLIEKVTQCSVPNEVLARHWQTSCKTHGSHSARE